MQEKRADYIPLSLSEIPSLFRKKVIPIDVALIHVSYRAGVVTTRANVRYIATEYGIAYLYGKNLAERAKALISIAHPMHREKLSEAVYQMKKTNAVIM